MAGSTDLVSLVMPVHRPRADWLEAAVASALGQTGCSLELIAVDDGCDPPLADVGGGDPRVRVVRIDHGGASQARNAGVAAAHGRWVRFVDADDVYEPGSTARLLRLTGDADDVIAYGATAFCDEHLRPVWTMTSRVQGDALVDCLLGRFTVRPQSLLFPRGLVEAAGGWDPELRVAEDWDLVLRCLESAHVRGERRVATYYRRHRGGLTADSAIALHDARRVVARYFDRHPDQRGTRLERAADGTLHALAARVAATDGRAATAVAEAARSLVADPRALTGETIRALPALRGHVVHRLRRRTARGAVP
jgi:glycosyltransferase involved in cell wall biosynthesis